jgi:hypothetical protein
MALKVKQGEDGAVTLLVPKADEVYDPEDGQLYIPCETTVEELAIALAPDEFDLDDGGAS